MAATYDQTPGVLNLAFRRGDDFSALCDFSVSLSGYSMTSTLISVASGEVVATFTTTVTDAAAGKVNVSLSDAQTSALAAGTYRWSMVGTAGALTKSWLEGFVEVAP